MPLRVLHLLGSATSEFLADLSWLYGRDCLQATADPARYEFVIAGVTPDGLWRFPTDMTSEAIDLAPPMGVAAAISHLISLRLDVVVPQMFCLPGMTSYRALFDLLGIPYVGNSADVMALGADKAKARAVVASAGVDVPPAQLLRPGDHPTLPLPVVVKPVSSDNSVGVSKVDRLDQLDEALRRAFLSDDRVLVEAYVDLGREVRCGIIERDGELMALPLEEYAVDPDSKPIRGEDDKIRRTDDGDLQLVAKDISRAWIVDLDDPVVERVHDAAKQAHRAIGCRHYSLFDFRIDPAGQPWFLEAGLYCSFACSSVISVMANTAGLSVSEIFAIAIGEATAARTLRGSPTRA